MYEFIAPVTDHTASTKPMIVNTRLEPLLFDARVSELWSRLFASAGMKVMCCMKFVMSCGLATSVKRPVATMITDGIAKNDAYASADASIIALSAMNSLPARMTIAFQSANVRSRRPGSGTDGSRCSGCGDGLLAESSRTASSATGRSISRAARRSEEHTSELQSHVNLVCRLLLEKKKKKKIRLCYDEYET